jgi:hypothetical protein
MNDNTDDIDTAALLQAHRHLQRLASARDNALRSQARPLLRTIEERLGKTQTYQRTRARKARRRQTVKIDK